MLGWRTAPTNNPDQPRKHYAYREASIDLGKALAQRPNEIMLRKESAVLKVLRVRTIQHVDFAHCYPSWTVTDKRRATASAEGSVQRVRAWICGRRRRFEVR